MSVPTTTVKEAVIDERIKKLIERRGGGSLKTTGVYVVGTPDRLCTYRGLFLAIEVKKPGNKPTPAQSGKLQWWAQRGAIAFWADDVDQVEAVLNEIDVYVDSRSSRQTVAAVMETIPERQRA
jgi:hypothetical protein